MCINGNYNHYKKLFRLHKIPLKKLNKEQKRAVDSVWKNCGKYDYHTHRLVYTATGKFDPKIVPEMLFRTKIEMELNNQIFKPAWSDKSYFSWWFNKELFPTNVVVNINGCFYDCNYNIVTEEQALNLISQYDRVIIKPSLDTGLGKGVQLIENCNSNPELKNILDKYRKNYVVQEVFQQHPLLASFNSSSVNVVRFISMFVDGKVYPLMSALRCGSAGAISDNTVTKDGMGMFVIGIDDNGVLKDKAYHSCGKSIKECPNGTHFNGQQVPGFEKMKSIIKECHSKMPHFGFIGWDFAIDTDGNPRIIEYNIKSPGVLYYQYVNGPLFGKDTDFVVSHFSKK